MPRVLVVRHAESSSNAGGRTSGDALISITSEGARQARRLADRIAEHPTLIVVSRYPRTRQTAAPLLDRYPDVPVEVWPVEEFTYLSPAACAQTTYSERESLRNTFWQRADPDWVDGPGCESFAAFLARVRRFEQSLAARAPGELLVVFSHGHFMQALLWLQRTQTPAMQDFDRFRQLVLIPNCGMVGRAGSHGAWSLLP